MRRLFDDIPLTEMNTSMTINATAMWLLALYQVVAEEQNPDLEPSEVAHQLAGTTQNDIIKEYLSRGTYVFPPEHSLRLTADMIAYTVHEIPKWNPINICSYHLQEAGATPRQELAYALCTAIAVLDAVRDSGQVVRGRLRQGRRPDLVLRQRRRPVRRGDLQDAGLRPAVGRDHPRALRRRPTRRCAGSATACRSTPSASPRRSRRTTCSGSCSRCSASRCRKNARARAVQLPAWNEALGLPRPWDQQWSLRLQQVLAFESDLLEYDDIFDGSHVIEAKVAELVAGARAEIDRVQALGGAIAAVESGYMKQALVVGHAARRAPDRGRRGDRRRRQQVRDHRAVAADRRPRRRDPGRRPARPRRPRCARSRSGRRERDEAEVDDALARLAADAKSDANLMAATLAAARAGATTGEWAGTLREVFGEFRAPTGVSGAVGVAATAGGGADRGPRRGCGRPATSWAGGCGCWSASPASTVTPTAPSRSRSGPATPASR